MCAEWTGVKWLADVDAVGFFGNIGHAILLRLLEQRIADQRFIALSRGMLNAGHTEDWRFHRTLSAPPRGVVSPMLAKIHLHELDQFLLEMKAGLDRGRQRAGSPSIATLPSAFTNAASGPRGR